MLIMGECLNPDMPEAHASCTGLGTCRKERSRRAGIGSGSFDLPVGPFNLLQAEIEAVPGINCIKVDGWLGIWAR